MIPLFTVQHAGPPQYELQAVVLHHGKKATGGHYSAFTLDTQQPASAAATEGIENYVLLFVEV